MQRTGRLDPDAQGRGAPRVGLARPARSRRHSRRPELGSQGRSGERSASMRHPSECHGTPLPHAPPSRRVPRRSLAPARPKAGQGTPRQNRESRLAPHVPNLGSNVGWLRQTSPTDSDTGALQSMLPTPRSREARDPARSCTGPRRQGTRRGGTHFLGEVSRGI